MIKLIVAIVLMLNALMTYSCIKVGAESDTHFDE